MLHDPLADALTVMKNYEHSGKTECTLKPASKLIKEILKVMLETGFIASFEFVEDGKAGRFKVKLNGKINECGAITPRYPIKIDELESYERKYLPGRGFGLLIVTTPQGILTHAAAKEKGLSGKLLAFVY